MKLRIFCVAIFVALVTQCATESITGLESLVQEIGLKSQRDFA